MAPPNFPKPHTIFHYFIKYFTNDLPKVFKIHNKLSKFYVYLHIATFFFKQLSPFIFFFFFEKLYIFSQFQARQTGLQVVFTCTSLLPALCTLYLPLPHCCISKSLISSSIPCPYSPYSLPLPSSIISVPTNNPSSLSFDFSSNGKHQGFLRWRKTRPTRKP